MAKFKITRLEDRIVPSACGFGGGSGHGHSGKGGSGKGGSGKGSSGKGSSCKEPVLPPC